MGMKIPRSCQRHADLQPPNPILWAKCGHLQMCGIAVTAAGGAFTRPANGTGGAVRAGWQ
jgi:hypothetical protein